MRSTVLLMHGYIGFGKTTIAKKFESMGYKRYTHDEYMSKMFGDHPSNEEFVKNYDRATEVILREAEEEVSRGGSVILDFGFWSRKSRDDIWKIVTEWGGEDDVSIIWVNVVCDIEIARQRCIDRDSKRKEGELWVPVEVFDMKLSQFEPMSDYNEYDSQLIVKV